jgi:hypothetical protein
LNATVGNKPVLDIIGNNGEDSLNSNGKSSIYFCAFNKLRTRNTYFRYKDMHKYIWVECRTRSIIDYVIINNKLKTYVLDSQIYRE